MVLTSSTFTFRFPPHPLSTPLTFPPYPTPAPIQSPLKRPLPLHDTAHIGSRKKRRLRLTLITSRLSRPFSTPATHAVDKGRSKIAVWAKSKRLCTGMLRKAAILNRMRQSLGNGMASTVGRRDSLIEDAQFGRQEGFLRPGMAMLRSVSVQSPSPLGLSNYDALDEEDGWVELETDEGEEAEPVLPLPDFGLPQPIPVEEEHCDSDPLDPPDPPDPPARSPNFVGGTVEVVKSPNFEWLASAFKTNKTNEALAPPGFMGKLLPGYRQDALAEFKREKERQRRLLDLRFE